MIFTMLKNPIMSKIFINFIIDSLKEFIKDVTVDTLVNDNGKLIYG